VATTGLDRPSGPGAPAPRRPPRRPALSRWLNSPILIATAGGVLVGAVIVVVTGHNPLQAYAAIVTGAVSGSNLAATVNRAIPIVGMGLCAAVAFRAGFFNIGGEGQLVIGGVTAAVVGVALPLPPGLHVVVAVVAAAVAGGLYALLAAVFQTRFGVPLLISTLLLNYPARELASYLANHPLRDVGSGLPQTYQVAATARLPELFGTRFHLGLVVIAVLVGAIVYVNQRTVAGYDMRMAGLNARFAEYGGVPLPRLAWSVMFSSGAIAGLVGAIEVLAIHHRFIDGSLVVPLYAWTGLMAALLAVSSPLGVVAAGLFFSGIQTGGFGMERATDVPRELSYILQAVVILFLAARTRFRFGGADEVIRS